MTNWCGRYCKAAATCPPYGKNLNPAEVAALVSFLRYATSSEPTAARDAAQEDASPANSRA